MRWDIRIRAFILITTVAFIIACSPKSNYDVLSVFFDGVPNPYVADSIAKADSVKQAEEVFNLASKPAKPEFIFHLPYLEKDCASCHDQNVMGRLISPMPGLCYQCHENFLDQYKILHGPVEAGYCTECHNPHMQKNENLLIRKGQELCLHCHTAADIFRSETHIDIEDTNCTDCHNPHGGDDKFIFN